MIHVIIFVCSDMHQAKETLLNEQTRQQFDEMRIEHYKSIGQTQFIDQPPSRNCVLDIVKEREGSLLFAWFKRFLLKWTLYITVIGAMGIVVFYGIKCLNNALHPKHKEN